MKRPRGVRSFLVKTTTKARSRKECAVRIKAWARGRPWHYIDYMEFKKWETRWWCYARTKLVEE